MPNNTTSQTNTPGIQRPAYTADTEISLLDIYLLIKDGWKWIASLSFISLLASTAYVLLAPPTYEASANIQIATVANTPVELPGTLAEKLKLPMYYTNETLSACNLDDVKTAAADLVFKLNPTLNRNAPIITVSYRHSSLVSAKNCIESVIADIRAQQNKIAKPMIASKKMQLQIMEDKLKNAETIKNQFIVNTMNTDVSDAKFSASALLFSTFVEVNNEINELRKEIFELQFSLSESQTRETYLATPIYAPDTHAGPKDPLIVLISILAGGFLGLVFLLIQTAFKTMEAQSRLKLSQF